MEGTVALTLNELRECSINNWCPVSPQGHTVSTAGSRESETFSITNTDDSEAAGMGNTLISFLTEG